MTSTILCQCSLLVILEYIQFVKIGMILTQMLNRAEFVIEDTRVRSVFAEEINILFITSIIYAYKYLFVSILCLVVLKDN